MKNIINFLIVVAIIYGVCWKPSYEVTVKPVKAAAGVTTYWEIGESYYNANQFSMLQPMSLGEYVHHIEKQNGGKMLQPNDVVYVPFFKAK